MCKNCLRRGTAHGAVPEHPMIQGARPQVLVWAFWQREECGSYSFQVMSESAQCATGRCAGTLSSTCSWQTRSCDLVPGVKSKKGKKWSSWPPKHFFRYCGHLPARERSEQGRQVTASDSSGSSPINASPDTQKKSQPGDGFCLSLYRERTSLSR